MDQVPPQFASFLNEPAFSISDTTFCIWCTLTDTAYQRGAISFPEVQDQDPDGSERLLWMLDGHPGTYREFAAAYYECSLNLELLEQIYAGTVLSRTLAASLNPEAPWEGILADAAKIGYPVAE